LELFDFVGTTGCDARPHDAEGCGCAAEDASIASSASSGFDELATGAGLGFGFGVGFAVAAGAAAFGWAMDGAVAGFASEAGGTSIAPPHLAHFARHACSFGSTRKLAEHAGQVIVIFMK
jgi:hypothetical protein